MQQDIETKVIEYIQAHPNSTAKDLMKTFSMHKSDLNKFLYAQKTKKVLDNDGATPPRWSVVGDAKLSPKKKEDTEIIVVFVSVDLPTEIWTTIVQKTIPYLSAEIKLVTNLGIDVPGQEKFHYVKLPSYGDEDEVDGFDIIAFGMWASAFEETCARDGSSVHFLLVSTSEPVTSFVGKRLKKATRITDGWDGLRVFVE